VTPEEFKKRLKQVQEVILRACCFRRVWIKLQYRDAKACSWSLDDQNAMLNRYPGFFNNVVIGMQEATLLNFARVFDSDKRTASLRVLLDAARGDLTLVPNCTPSDLDELEDRIASVSKTIKSLRRARDQRLAHMAAKPAPDMPILNKELGDLADTIKDIYNGLSTGHDKNYYDWDYMLSRAEDDTTHVMLAVMGRN
jgi:hypothetical protein